MKIDFVIPWVDDKDKKWLAKKNKFQQDHERIESDDIRFKDWELLKYFFRGVSQYAPWVNKIYLITDNQCPKWLDVNNKKVVVIDHKDYIPKKYLPVFSSHPIELNLHRINDLSEHFVYFNDDYFIVNKCDESDFFVDGLPCDYAVESPITPNHKDIFNNILMNNIVFLNSYANRSDFYKNAKGKIFSLADIRLAATNLCFVPLRRRDFFGFEYSHLNSNILKSSLEKIWQIDYDVLDEVCSHRFRSADDINQYAILQYQYVNGLYYPYSWRKNGKAFQLDDSNNSINDAVDAINDKKYKIICLNDFNISDYEKTIHRLVMALDAKFPNKCEFEK